MWDTVKYKQALYKDIMKQDKQSKRSCEGPGLAAQRAHEEKLEWSLD